MRTLLGIILSISIVLLDGCGSDHWVKVSPIDSSFTVFMPAEPSEKEIDQNTPSGNLKIIEYSVTINEVNFSLHYTDYASNMMIGKTSDLMLDPGIERMFVTNPHAHISSAKTLILGFPARNFTMDDPTISYTTFGKSCLVGQRAYLLQVVTPSKLIAKQDIDHFMGSFQLTAKPY